jgi:methylmalonyl-CoA/ethylmalonyl-CoA epimerase
MRDPVFTETIQIAIVVRDLDAAMRTYVHDYGIGPWDVYEFNPGNVANMREDGQPVERSWRLAVAQFGQVQWELIEPLDGESIYARFLAEKGEGVHHVGVAVPSFDETVAAQAEKGNGVLLGGEYNGVTFAYLSTDRDLGVITEIFSAPPGLEQKPDAVYPP